MQGIFSWLHETHFCQEEQTASLATLVHSVCGVSCLTKHTKATQDIIRDAQQLECCVLHSMSMLDMPPPTLHCRYLLLPLQVITHCLEELQQQVTTFICLETDPDKRVGEMSGLQLCAAWSAMVEVFLALQSKLTSTDGPEVTSMTHSFLQMVHTLKW